MVEEEVSQDVEQKDPPSKVLWSALRSNGFPLEYDAFISEMSDENNRATLYNKVKAKGIFTKTSKEFDDFFVDVTPSKKKESTQQLPAYTNVSTPVAQPFTMLSAEGSTKKPMLDPFNDPHPEGGHYYAEDRHSGEIQNIDPQSKQAFNFISQHPELENTLINKVETPPYNPFAGMDYFTQMDKIQKDKEAKKKLDETATSETSRESAVKLNKFQDAFENKFGAKLQAPDRSNIEQRSNDFISKEFSGFAPEYTSDISEHLNKLSLDDPKRYQEIVSRTEEENGKMSQKEKAALLQGIMVDKLQAQRKDLDIYEARLKRGKGKVDLDHATQLTKDYNQTFNDVKDVIKAFPEEYERQKQVKANNEAMTIQKGDNLGTQAYKQVYSTIGALQNSLIKGGVSTLKFINSIADQASGSTETRGVADKSVDAIADYLDTWMIGQPTKYKDQNDLQGETELNKETFLPQLSGTLGTMALMFYGGAGNAVKLTLAGAATSYNDYYETGKGKNLTTDQAQKYGLFMSGIQGLLENVNPNFGVMEFEKLGVKEGIQFLAENPNATFGKFAKKVGKGLLGENFQEITQLIGDKTGNMATNQVLGKDAFDTKMTAKELGETVVLTTAVSLLAGGLGKGHFDAQHKESLKLLQESTPELVEKEVNELIKGRKITSEQGQNILDLQSKKIEEANIAAAFKVSEEQVKNELNDKKVAAKDTKQKPVSDTKTEIPENKKVKEISEEELLNDNKTSSNESKKENTEVIKEGIEEKRSTNDPIGEVVERDIQSKGEPNDRISNASPSTNPSGVEKTDNGNVSKIKIADEKTNKPIEPVNKTEQSNKTPVSGDIAIVEQPKTKIDDRQADRTDIGNNVGETKEQRVVEPVVAKMETTEKPKTNQSVRKGIFGNIKALEKFEPLTSDEKQMLDIANGGKINKSDFERHFPSNSPEYRRWKQFGSIDETNSQVNAIDVNNENFTEADNALGNIIREHTDRHQVANELKRRNAERNSMTSKEELKALHEEESQNTKEITDKAESKGVNLSDNDIEEYNNFAYNVKDIEEQSKVDKELGKKYDDHVNRISNDAQYQNEDGSFNYDKLLDNVKNGFEPDIFELYNSANKIGIEDGQAIESVKQAAESKQPTKRVEASGDNAAQPTETGSGGQQSGQEGGQEGGRKGLNEQRLDTQISAKKAEVKKASDKLSERGAQREELKKKAAKQLKKENQSDIFGDKKGDKLFDDPLSVGTKDQNVFTAFDNETKSLQTAYNKAAKELDILEKSKPEVQKSDKAQQALFDSNTEGGSSSESVKQGDGERGQEGRGSGLEELKKQAKERAISIQSEFDENSKDDRPYFNTSQSEIEKRLTEFEKEIEKRKEYHSRSNTGAFLKSTGVDHLTGNEVSEYTGLSSELGYRNRGENSQEVAQLRVKIKRAERIGLKTAEQAPTPSVSEPVTAGLSVQQKKIANEIKIVEKQIEGAKKGTNQDRVKILEKKKAELVRRMEIAKNLDTQEAHKPNTPTELDEKDLVESLTDPEAHQFDRIEAIDAEIIKARKELAAAKADISFNSGLPFNQKQIEASVKLGYLQFKKVLLQTGQKMSLSDMADFFNVPISDQLKSIHDRIIDAWNSESSAAFRDKLNFFQDGRRKFQDLNIAVKIFYNDLIKAGVPITDQINFAEMQELTQSRVEFQQNKTAEWFKGKKGGELRGVQKSKNDSWVGRVVKEIGSYQAQSDFMYARHALDYNARAREIQAKGQEERIKGLDEKIDALQNEYTQNPDNKLKEKINKLNQEKADIQNEPILDKPSGLSDSEAQAFIDEAKKAPIKYDKMVKFADEFRKEIVTKRIDLMEKSGIISAESAQNMREGKREGYVTEMPNYLPLKVKSENFQDKRPVSQSKLGAAIQKIKGTDSYVKEQRYDPIKMAYEELQATHHAAISNETFLALYGAVKESPFGENIRIVNTRGTYAADETGALKETRPEQKPEAAALLNENAIPFRDSGKIKYIYFNPVKNAEGGFSQHPIVRAVKFSGGKDDIFVRTLFNAYRTAANYLRLIRTSYNLEFAVANPFRDLGEAISNISDVSKDNATVEKVRLSIIGNMPKTFAFFFNPTTAEPKAFERMGKYFEEMQENGVMMSWRNVDGLDKRIENLETEINRIEKGKGRTGKEKVEATFKTLSAVSDASENMTRLAAFVAMRENGFSAQKAAYVTKNLTLNFEKKGEYSSKSNLIWMFSNVGIQASSRMISTAKSKNFWRFGAAMTMFAAANRAALFMGMDDDNEDKWIYDKMANEGTTMIFNPFDHKNPIRLPKPYSAMRIFLNMGESLTDVYYGKRTAMDAASNNMVASMTGAIDPIGGQGGSMTNYLPTEFLKNYWQVQANENWQDQPIFKGQGYADKISQEEYLRTNTSTDYHFDQASMTLHDKTGIDIQPSTLEFIWQNYGKNAANALLNYGKIGNAVLDATTGKEVNQSEVPALRRFYYEADEKKGHVLYGIMNILKDPENVTKEQIRYIDSQLLNLRKDASINPYMFTMIDKKLTEAKDPNIKKERDARQRQQTEDNIKAKEAGEKTNKLTK